MRLNFTTRDWLWFCVVTALAIGWGTHVRYTDHASPPKPLPDSELLRLLDTAYEQRDSYIRDLDALRFGIRSAGLTAVQLNTLNAAERKRRDLPVLPGADQ